MNEMQKSQPSLHIKNPQKPTGCSIRKSKAFKTKISKGVDIERKFTVKFTTNTYERFRSKQTRLAVHDVSKSYVKTTSHIYVAKLESQQREELRIRTLQSASACSRSASMPLEQSINTFLFSRRKQKTNAVSHLTRYSFYNRTVQKVSKNWLKNTRLKYV